MGVDEPSMYRHGLGTRKTERSNMSRIEDTINMKIRQNKVLAHARDDPLPAAAASKLGFSTLSGALRT